MTCEGCPYKGAKKIKYRLVENTDIMIIQEAPTREELLNGKLLCGRSGQLLKQLITKYQLNNYNISFVYSCKCEINKQDKKEANAAVKICKPNILEAINKVKPKIIVTFGELASKQLLGSKISGGILANRGRIIHNDELDVDIFIAVHPEYVLRGCSSNYPNKPYELMSPKERMIFDDISLLQKVCENDFKSLGINTENYKEATLKDLEDISKSKVVAVDIETTGVGIGNNIKILSISFSYKPEHSRVVLLKDGDIQDINIKSKVNEILTNENISKVVAGRPFDENMWKKKLGVEWKGNIHDVLVMAHLVNENLPNGYNLESVAETFAHMRNIKDVAKGKRKCLTEEDKDILIIYNGVDSDATIRVYLKLKEELSKDKLLLRYYMKFLKPTLDMYADIGFYGFPLNINDIKDSENNLSVLAEELHNSLIDELPTLIKVMHEKKGLKLSRSELILDYMFGNKKFTLGLKPKKFTNKTMKPTTDEKHLKEFSNIEWVSGLLRWKKANKLLTTYYPQLYSAINDDGCIYPTTLFINTVTGRTVVLNPTIQTIPQRGEFAGYIKKVFKAPDGWKLCARDLAQSELRIIGWMAKDKNILDALDKGIDLHTKTAAIVNNVDVSKVTKDMRQKAKPVNFGFCLTPDTMITTDRGLIPITCVKVGDKVYTHKHRWKRVTALQKLHADTILEIRTNTGKVVKCTKDHKWLTVLPAGNHKKNTYVFKEACKLTVGDNLVFGGIRDEVPTEIDNDYLVLGWFLSEGSVFCKKGVNVTIKQHIYKNKDVFDRMKKILPDYDFTCHIDYESKIASFIAYNKKSRIYNLLDSKLYEKYSYSKDKSTKGLDIHSLDTKKVISLLAGLYDGDGCITMSNNRLNIVYISKSEYLIKDVQTLLLRVGINSKIYKYDNRNVFELYVVGSNSKLRFLKIIPTIKTKRVNYNPKKMFVDKEKIISIKEIKYNDYVYDFTVEDDHSFVANGLFSHNCYGMQAKSFVTYAKDYYGVDFTLEEAENVRKNFFAYPTGYYKLPEYHSRMIGLARRYGHIRTPLGRVRRLPAIHSNEYMLRGDAERQAINTPVQSFSSDLALIGKLLFYYKLKELGWLNTKVKLLWFIHDAVMFMAREEVAMDAHKMLKEIYLYDVPKFIKNTFKVDVTYPVESDGKIGDNWSEMTEVE